MSTPPPARPRGLMKLFFRFPVWLYRLGLAGMERLFGARWLLITTRGRKSGRPHQAMVDVMREADGVYVVAASRGLRTDWLLNIQAQGEFRAQVGRRQFRARARLLQADEIEAVARAYYHSLPSYLRSLYGRLGYPMADEAAMLQTARGWTLLAIQEAP